MQERCIEWCKELMQPWQAAQRLTQLGQIARPCRTEGYARQDALHVANAVQCLMQSNETLIFQQGGDGVLAQTQDSAIAQWSVDPAAQQAAAHGACGAIHYSSESIAVVAGDIDLQFQVAAAGAV